MHRNRTPRTFDQKFHNCVAPNINKIKPNIPTPDPSGEQGANGVRAFDHTSHELRSNVRARLRRLSCRPPPAALPDILYHISSYGRPSPLTLLSPPQNQLRRTPAGSSVPALSITYCRPHTPDMNPEYDAHDAYKRSHFASCRGGVTAPNQPRRRSDVLDAAWSMEHTYLIEGVWLVGLTADHLSVR